MIAKFFDEHSRAWRYYSRVDSVKKYAFRFELADEQRSDLTSTIVEEIIPAHTEDSKKKRKPQKIYVNAVLVATERKENASRRFKVISLGILNGPIIVLAYQEGYLLNEHGATVETL